MFLFTSTLRTIQSEFFLMGNIQLKMLESCVCSLTLYRKIHYLTREFQVKLQAKTDISFQVQFDVEFTSQVMDFP